MIGNPGDPELSFKEESKWAIFSSHGANRACNPEGDVQVLHLALFFYCSVNCCDPEIA